MAKVTINDEMFAFDTSRRPMTEALVIEEALKCTYTEFETDLQKGSARAMAAYVWAVWHRDGRDVTIEDILSGKAEVDVAGLKIEADEGDTDPTSPSPVPSVSTGGVISASSPSSSASGPGRSISSSRRSSKP